MTEGAPSNYFEYLKSLSFPRLFLGQTLASFGESGVLHAFELLTTRLQFKGDHTMAGLRSEAVKLHSDGGIRSFYRGYGFTAAINVPSELIYRTTYDYNCRALGKSPFLAGFLADTLISVFQVPAEVISQRLQVAPRGTSALSIAKSLYFSGGIAAFYKTINIALLVHPFQAGSWWFFYEKTRKATDGSLLASSVVASVLVSAIFNPVVVVKTQLQTGRSSLTGPQLFMSLIKTRHGRLSLLTAGLVTSMTRAVFEGFIHAFTYETVFDYAKRHS